MTVFLTIVVTMAFDWGLGYLVSYNKKKQLERDEDVYKFKIEQILTNKDYTQEEAIEKAKELSRMTKSNIATGVYIALDDLQKRK